MDSLIFSSVENIPGVSARAAFTVNSAAVFREDCDIMPTTFGNIKYMPWGADNQMPYDIIDLIERDETLATCQIFNAEICYGGGMSYALPQTQTDSQTDSNRSRIENEVEDFQLDNDLASYFSRRERCVAYATSASSKSTDSKFSCKVTTFIQKILVTLHIKLYKHSVNKR